MRMSKVAMIMSLVLILASEGQIKVVLDRNRDASATSAFKFKNVPSPAKDDIAANAKLTLLDGELDPNGADMGALIDGVCQR